MKKITVLFRMLAVCCLSAAAASSFAQVKADVLELQDPKSFSIALLPDVQNYVKYDYNQPILELLTAWIADNKENLNIKAALCTGDLVDQNECLVPPFPRFGNLTSKQQWEFVSHAFARLDNRVPYVICPGNHDYGYTRSEVPITHFPEYFTVERNPLNKGFLVAAANNRLGVPTLENAAFEVKDEHWGDLLVISLEFGPRDEVMEWAKNLCESEQYRNHKVIVLTHSYIGEGNDPKFIKNDHYKMRPLTNGADMWEKLVKTTANIRMVICGHYGVANEKLESATGFKVSKNDAGKEVCQMMFNTQTIGGGFSGNGGDGWLRILEFKPDGKTVKVTTYSPLFGFSSRTKDMALSTLPCNDFSFKIE